MKQKLTTSKLTSLEQLAEAIEMGLDIEFFISDERYNISWRNNKPFICVCPDGDAVFYKNADDLLHNHLINGIPVKDLWQDIDVYSM